MSQLFEVSIRPGESKVYLRLILVAYFLTFGLIAYSALYWPIKLLLSAVIVVLLYFDCKKKTPHHTLCEIQFIGNKWILASTNGRQQHYSNAQILIHNVLFQLIQFTHLKQKKSIVLFHDQVPSRELRLLHLKIAQN